MLEREKAADVALNSDCESIGGADALHHPGDVRGGKGLGKSAGKANMGASPY